MSETGVSINLTGASAVVTGSTRGIGAKVAKRLAAAGAAVVVSGRTASEGNAVVDEIRDNGGTAISYEFDVRNPDKIEHLSGKYMSGQEK
jgi:NAD(P)-dependent dehydrogenase (short-subunit alcohol dehydrogenase family)